MCFIVLDLASSSPLDYVGDVAILVSVGLLFYGIYKVSFFIGEHTNTQIFSLMKGHESNKQN